MQDSVHHIRLVATLEIEPGSAPQRTLDRHATERLAGHLADDLLRVAPGVEHALGVFAGALFEPAELTRPGFPAWAAIEELAGNTRRERGFAPGVLAIGAHRGRLPHSALQPPDDEPGAPFLALPATLVCESESAEGLRGALEEVLFERGSIQPPARALLEEAAGLASVHGQLLTLADFVALQQVQLDSAGFGGFWPVVEHALLDAGQARAFDLPGELTATWRVATRAGETRAGRLDIDFLSFDQHAGDVDEYAVWTRAFRMLTALLEAHGVEWRAQPTEPVVYDAAYRSMIESLGTCDHADGITLQQHPEVGLMAWTVVEDGRMMHVYPLSARSAERVMGDLAARGLHRYDDEGSMHYDPETGRLQPAT
jgi:hypothetical protein